MSVTHAPMSQSGISERVGAALTCCKVTRDTDRCNHERIRFSSGSFASSTDCQASTSGRRARLFPLEKVVSRFLIFSFWQAVWFVLVPVLPLRRADHQRSIRPAPAFPQSGRDRSLPTSSMTGKFGGDADWES